MHSFTRGVTARAQLFVYKLYTFFVGCNALVLPLQHFTFVIKQIVLTTMKRMLNRMLCSIRFAANAENIRTKEHKNKRNYVRVSRLARKT